MLGERVGRETSHFACAKSIRGVHAVHGVFAVKIGV